MILSAFLANSWSPFTGSLDFTVNNSPHFTSRSISSETIQDQEIMVSWSFDVASLFINVTIEGTARTAFQKLEIKAIPPKLTEQP